jgi:hypothetical protein
VLVDLVGDDDRVMALGQLGDEGADLRREYRARGVVGIVDEDRARTVGDSRRQLVEIGLKTGPPQANGHEAGVRQADRGGVRVVEGLEDHDLVARFEKCEEGRRQRLRRAGGDEDLVLRVPRKTVEALLMLRDGVPQIHRPATGRVLVVPLGDGATGGLENLRGSVLVREALAQVDRAGAAREGRHLCENRRSDLAARAEEAGSGGRAPPRSGYLRHVVRLPATNSHTCPNVNIDGS